MSHFTGVLHYYFDAKLKIRQSEASFYGQHDFSLEM
jgi:hypothetical protein